MAEEVKVLFQHDANCPLGTNGLAAYSEARDALSSTPPEARNTERDRQALAQAEYELEETQVCRCGAEEKQRILEENVAAAERIGWLCGFVLEETMDFATALATKARELTDGMQQRVKRNPDIADYRAAFLPIIAEFLSPDAKTHDPRNGKTLLCGYKDCQKRAIFMRYGNALCFEHRNEYGTTEKADQQFNH